VRAKDSLNFSINGWNYSSKLRIDKYNWEILGTGDKLGKITDVNSITVQYTAPETIENKEILSPYGIKVKDIYLVLTSKTNEDKVVIQHFIPITIIEE